MDYFKVEEGKGIDNSGNALDGILEIENSADRLEALRRYFENLPAESIPEQVKQVCTFLKDKDLQSAEHLLNFLAEKKLINRKSYRELFHKGPRVGTEGEHDMHLGSDIKKTFN